jgi:S1-C subfamily serine protease
MNWAWFGFRLQALEDFDLNIRFDAAEGVIVAGTDPESPARKAGFLPNDRIVAVNGMPVLARTPESLPEIRRKLGLMPFGKEVRFQVIRDGKTLEITVAPAEKGKVEGSSAVLKQWGFSVKAINRFDNPQLHFYMPEGGVFVFGVDWRGIARGKLQQEDVIAAVNGVPVKTVEAIRNAYETALQQIDRNNHVILDVVRGGRSRQIVLQFSRETPGK